MSEESRNNATTPRSVDQQQACSACSLIHELQARMSAIEKDHQQLVWEAAKAAKWEPQGCDDQPVGIAELFCKSCRTCHHPLSGRPVDIGPSAPDGIEGPVGMPGLRGPNADGTPGETDEEHMQRYRDAIAHNERFFAKYPHAANSEPNAECTNPEGCQ